MGPQLFEIIALETALIVVVDLGLEECKSIIERAVEEGALHLGLHTGHLLGDLVSDILDASVAFAFGLGAHLGGFFGGELFCAFEDRGFFLFDVCEFVLDIVVAEGDLVIAFVEGDDGVGDLFAAFLEIDKKAGKSARKDQVQQESEVRKRKDQVFTDDMGWRSSGCGVIDGVAEDHQRKQGERDHIVVTEKETGGRGVGGCALCGLAHSRSSLPSQATLRGGLV